MTATYLRVDVTQINTAPGPDQLPRKFLWFELFTDYDANSEMLSCNYHFNQEVRTDFDLLMNSYLTSSYYRH